jgi:hypothetical protein
MMMVMMGHQCELKHGCLSCTGALHCTLQLLRFVVIQVISFLTG